LGNDDATDTAYAGTTPPRARKERVAVVIPTFLEAESIAAVVAALPRDIVDRVVVVDGGSPDGTAEVARRAGAEVITVGRGYGRACQAGAQAAEDADIIVFMDSDGADDPLALTGMVDAISSGRFDFVIGSRALGKREEGSMAGHQLAAGLVAGALIWLLYGIRYTDMCAYRAIRRNALLAEIVDRADQRAANVIPIMRQIQRSGATSLRQIAEDLNARGINAPRGGQWHATSVRNVMARA
jgi:glycosyltransferase involved in cell wall biosynthesis